MSEQEVRAALRLAPIQSDNDLLPDQFSETFNLEDVLDRIAWAYIKRARRESGDKITKAAKLLGYDHYQVLSRKEKKLKEKFLDDE